MWIKEIKPLYEVQKMSGIFVTLYAIISNRSKYKRYYSCVHKDILTKEYFEKIIEQNPEYKFMAIGAARKHYSLLCASTVILKISDVEEITPANLREAIRKQIRNGAVT